MCAGRQQHVSAPRRRYQLSRHPNVVAMHGVCGAPRLGLVMEHMAGGSVADAAARAPLSRQQQFTAARDAAAGVANIHSAGFIHRDITTANVLVADARVSGVKVGDFGLAQRYCPGGGAVIDKVYGQGYGQGRRMAPEAREAGEMSTASDAYMFGVLLWDIFEAPATTARPGAGQVPADFAGMRLSRTPPDVAALIERLMSGSPRERPHLAVVAAELGRSVARLRG